MSSPASSAVTTAPTDLKAVESATIMPALSASVGGPVADRTRQLLEGPIAPTLLRLAAPNLVVMTVQAAVNAGEAYFLGWLGADALAGVSLAFPLIMLMQTMSAGGMGGGVSAAVARALGAGRRSDADALVLHAVVIATLMAAAFTAALLLGGPALYRALGGTGGASFFMEGMHGFVRQPTHDTRPWPDGARATRASQAG